MGARRASPRCEGIRQECTHAQPGGQRRAPPGRRPSRDALGHTRGVHRVNEAANGERHGNRIAELVDGRADTDAVGAGGERERRGHVGDARSGHHMRPRADTAADLVRRGKRGRGLLDHAEDTRAERLCAHPALRLDHVDAVGKKRLGERHLLVDRQRVRDRDGQRDVGQQLARAAREVLHLLRREGDALRVEAVVVADLDHLGAARDSGNKSLGLHRRNADGQVGHAPRDLHELRVARDIDERRAARLRRLAHVADGHGVKVHQARDDLEGAALGERREHARAAHAQRCGRLRENEHGEELPHINA
mmetsp:Transcript_5955/g.18683  ORF Transcript_5955/g.18683 Transcript_5955/m.18683 type:complete len:307 (+) Transcript_5955:216-1136(+)